jgi:hypothetical protein
MHNKVDARPHPPGSTCCMSLHAAAEMLGDPARKKGRSSMDLWRSNRARTTHGAAIYCHCGLVYGARVARGCPCNVISQPVLRLPRILVVVLRARRHRQTGTGSTNNNTDCCVGGIMVVGLVDVASDALLDSPGRLFWHIVIVESSRGTHAPRRSHRHHPSALHAVSYL